MMHSSHCEKSCFPGNDHEHENSRLLTLFMEHIYIPGTALRTLYVISYFFTIALSGRYGNYLQCPDEGNEAQGQDHVQALTGGTDDALIGFHICLSLLFLLHIRFC